MPGSMAGFSMANHPGVLKAFCVSLLRQNETSQQTLLVTNARLEASEAANHILREECMSLREAVSQLQTDITSAQAALHKLSSTAAPANAAAPAPGDLAQAAVARAAAEGAPAAGAREAVTPPPATGSSTVPSTPSISPPPTLTSNLFSSLGGALLLHTPSPTPASAAPAATPKRDLPPSAEADYMSAHRHSLLRKSNPRLI